MAVTLSARPGALASWRLAARLPTLTASVAPVAAGTGIAIHEGGFSLLPALAALVGAVALQVGANLANDVFDFRRGADGPQRLGPPRASSSGLLTDRQVLAGMWIAFGIASAAGVILAVTAGWLVVIVGLASIAAAIAYTGGPWPVGYHALGDLFTLLFFGLVAVSGTYFVQAGDLPGETVVASLAVGCTVTAILVVNNLRDIEVDRACGKVTLAVVLGSRATRVWFAVLVAGAYGVALGLSVAGPLSVWGLVVLASLPFAAGPLGAVLGGTSGAALNPVLKATARFNLAFGLAFGLAFALS